MKIGIFSFARKLSRKVFFYIDASHEASFSLRMVLPLRTPFPQNPPHPFTRKKKAVHTRVLLLGMVIVNEKAIRTPKSIQGQRNLLMKEDFFKNPNSSLALAREPRYK